VSRDTKWVTGGVYKGTPSAILEELSFVVYNANQFYFPFSFFFFHFPGINQSRGKAYLKRMAYACNNF
jgi:hypothetical protein